MEAYNCVTGLVTLSINSKRHLRIYLAWIWCLSRVYSRMSSS